VESRYVPLVVTAKHVIGDHAEVYGRYTPLDGRKPVTVEYDLAEFRKSGDLWEHTDSGVDIVVFRSPPFDQTKYQPIPLDLIASRQDFTDQHIQSMDRIIWPGLLVNFMGSERICPVIRNGTIALIPTESIPMKYMIGNAAVETRQELILIEGTAVPGASGRPVFLWSGPRVVGPAFNSVGTKPYVLGVLHGFYPASHRQVLEINLTKTVTMYGENSGGAIIFPSWRLREIIEFSQVKLRFEQLLK